MPAAIPFITTSNARELALLSWAKRKARAAAAPIVSTALQPAIPDAEERKQRALARVLTQLDTIDEKLEHAKDAKEWDMYTRAKERLGKFWFHLGGIAPPKAVAQSRAPRRAYAQQPMPAGWESTPDASKTEPCAQAQANTTNTTQPNVAAKPPEASQ